VPRSLPRLPPRAAYALVAAIIGFALFASVTPTPLYDVYRQEWGFSAFTLTAVFAVYAVCVLVSLLLLGRISDDAGRRPVLAGSLVVLLVATGLFLAATSVEWLFAARALQGLATGVAMGSAGAALLDLHPRHDGDAAGLTNGVVSAVGMGTGALVSAALLELAPSPLHLPFVVVAIGFAVLLAGTLCMPEPVRERRRPSLRPQWPHVPHEIRGAFALAGLGVLAAWSIGGLYMSLGPRLAADVMGTDNQLVAGGLSLLGLTTPGAVTQFLFRDAAPWRLTAVGSLVMGIGVAALTVSLSTGSAALYLGASFVSGAGWGCAFLGSLRSLTTVIPEDHRAEVMSAFYVVAYASLSVPALLAGLAVTQWGLLDAARGFSAVVVLLTLIVAVGATMRRGAPTSAGRPPRARPPPSQRPRSCRARPSTRSSQSR